MNVTIKDVAKAAGVSVAEEEQKDDNPPPIVAETVTHNLLPP